MLESLLLWDTDLFLAINKGWSNSTLDIIMPWLREMEHWFPLYGVLIILLAYLYRLKAIGILLIMGAMIFTGDNLLSGNAKRTFKRPRPCHEPALEGKMIERVNCGGAHGFFSAHATNHFAIAVFLVVLLRRKWKYTALIALPWAASIALAQVYVGVHYPLDIIAGTIAGSLIGVLFGLLALRVLKIRKSE